MNNASVAKQSGEPSAVLTVDTCYSSGLEALEQGRLDDARAWGERCGALPDAARSPHCAALQGRVAAAEGDFREAANNFRKAAALDPSDLELPRQLAEALQTIGQLEEAIEVLEKLTRRDSNSPELFIDLGYALFAHGNSTGARQALERAAALRPADKAVLFALAQLYQAIGEPALAAEVLSKQFGGEASPRVLNDLARLYLHLQRYSEAEATLHLLRERDRTAQVMAQHGIVLCRARCKDWRGALDAALEATRSDRFGLTTAFLAYAKDGFFGSLLDAAERDAELMRRLHEEMDEYAEEHNSEAVVWQSVEGVH
ncbi:MAG: tetratricopeptide repeat protein [Acidobacteriia bacterium]|nr:tetratricopeptide repeat protein [Terriglobia bacterium]